MSSTNDDGLLRVLVVVLAVVLLFPILMMVVAMPMMGTMGMWGMGGVYSPLAGLLVGLLPLLVLVAVGYVVYRAVVDRGVAAPSDPALEEVRLAYARGELSDEEFEERREKLRGGPSED